MYFYYQIGDFLEIYGNRRFFYLFQRTFKNHILKRCLCVKPLKKLNRKPSRKLQITDQIMKISEKKFRFVNMQRVGERC